MNVRVYVYVSMCTCLCVHVYVYVSMCTCLCVHVYVYMSMCTCICLHVHVFAYMYMYLCTYMHFCCVQICVCICMSVFTVRLKDCFYYTCLQHPQSVWLELRTKGNSWHSHSIIMGHCAPPTVHATMG